jgi:hypothetical protein
VFAGILENWFSFEDDEKADSKEDTRIQDGASCCSEDCAPVERQAVPPAGLVSNLLAGFKYGCKDVWGDIVFWFFAGLLIAGVITVLIPEDISEMVLGGGLLSMLTMLAIGMPLYICATASTPVAAALLLKGASPGAVLVFLLAGPATNMTSLSVLTRILGKSGTVRYLAVIAVSSILFGLGVDWLYQFLAIEPRAIIAEARETMPFAVKCASALFLLCLSFYHLVLWCRKKRSGSNTTSYMTGFPILNPAQQKKCGSEQSFPKKIDH